VHDESTLNTLSILSIIIIVILMPKSASGTYATVSIDLPVPTGHEDAAEPARQALQSLAPFVVERTIEQQGAVLRGVLDKIIETTPLRALDAERSALEQRAIAAVFSGAEWLTAEQVGRLRDPGAKNPHGAVNRWRTEGKLFALPKGGVLYYPRYAFDEVMEPRPVLAQVIALLHHYSPYRVASWFESTNGHLGGRRPREALAADAQAVIAAARAHAAGPVHG
jgi:hypothetical protein